MKNKENKVKIKMKKEKIHIFEDKYILNYLTSSFNHNHIFKRILKN